MDTPVKQKISLSDLSYDKLTCTRNQLSEKISDAEKVVEELKGKRERVDREFLRRFNEEGISSIKTRDYGTPYTIERSSVSVADKEVFMNWMRENNAFDFMEVRASKTMVVAYKEQHEDLPPGLNWSSKLAIGVKRS